MSEPREPGAQRATGESGVVGSRGDASRPSGSSVPETDLPERPARTDPTTSSLTEMVTDEPPAPAGPS
jgi:hypothetical protein